MIILRIIYLFDGNTPDDLLKNSKDFKKEKQFENNKSIDKIDIDNSKNKLNFNNSREDNVKINKNYVSINNFREFVEMFFKKREGLLHTQLYNDVTLVSFKEGELELNLEKIKDKSFPRTIAKLISKWTGRIWIINKSSGNLGKTLYEEDIINQQNQIEVMKNNTEVKKILTEFPGSKIHSITDLYYICKNFGIDVIMNKLVILKLKRRNDGKFWKYDETSSGITKKNG